jgi:hypothetical protein
MPASKGHIPTGALEGGRDPNGEGYYIGRFHHNGAVRIGKVSECINFHIPELVLNIYNFRPADIVIFMDYI